MNANIAKFSNIKRYSKGDVMVREKDPSAKEMLLLLQGSAGVYQNYKLNNEFQVRVLSQGNYYGEMALFLGKDPEQTIVALTDVIAVVVNKKNLSEFFTAQSDTALDIVSGICSRLYETERQLDKLQNKGEQTASQRSSLFPEGHGSYMLNLDNENEEFLYTQRCTCPLCDHTFDHMTVLTTRLRIDRTDKDLRVRYKGFEPLLYEIISCPNCYLSVSADAFPSVSKKWIDSINQKVGPFKLDTYITTGKQRDTFTVFAGYYLAILCASVCFDDYQLTTASLWQKLSRLYQDCEDEAMYLYASQKALDDYIYAYEHFRISERQMQQLCYVIGDLYQRTGDLNNARNYFFLAKSNRAGTNVMARQADLRLDDIRDLLKQQAPV